MEAWTIRKSPRKLRSWWKTKKEEFDKTKSYLDKWGQNIKKEGDNSYKGRERKNEGDIENIRCDTLGVKIVTKKDNMNTSFPFLHTTVRVR